MKVIALEKILPAVTIDQSAKAIAVAEALLAGGIHQMEITFRTTATIESITAIRNKFPQMLIGAGTILTLGQLHQAKEAGAQFGLAPGLNPKIVAEANRIDFPFIPGVMTPSDIECALDMDCKILKLFPAGGTGGIDMIKALNGPYAHTGVQFIPMGGVHINNMNDYLSIKNVVAIGGSWLASETLVFTAAYEEITANAKEAVAKIERK
jgi:2-dehydro-3-deoxyphosphogluconate aldolase/(4S)-4-hydroxy-2-oxoglutarate aldolase